VAQAGEHPEFVEGAQITWADTDRGRGPSGAAIRTGEVQVNQNVETNPVMTPWRAEMLQRGLQSSISLPLRNGPDVFGCLTLYSGEVDSFGPDEVELLKQLAADLSFGIYAQRDHAGRESATSALQDSLRATVQAVATALEMRDAYTAGHQRHVADLAAAIAREIALPEQQIEGIYLAALIHDIGKINIPAEILSKPNKLSPLEYQMMQTHVQTGYDIIKGISFPWPIGQIILQHHERLDGSGYPNHLKGEAILIEARVLAVADVIDAMRSHRPYRAALGLDAALDEIEKGKGKLYDPAAVDACVGLFRSKGFEFT
jgi:putative nucleotidyltransferase with HDIG domain